MSHLPPQDEWLIRCARLQQLLEENEMDGCMVSQNISIYYFTGSMQSGYLFIPKTGQPTYYVRRSLIRAQAESKVRCVELIALRTFGTQLEQDYPYLFESSADVGVPRICADLDVLPAQIYLRLIEAFPLWNWTDGSMLLRKVRSVKSAYEIACISRAANVVAGALEEGVGCLKEGMTELELLAVIENSIRRRGHIGIMRMRGYNQEIMTGVVAAGAAAAEPTYFDGPAGGRGLSPAAPQGASHKPIMRNEPVIIDIGCCIDGYTIDQTRMAVIGAMEPMLLAAYRISVAILKRCEDLLRPGAIPEELYTQALEMADSAGLSSHFMGYGRDQVKFLGHGIGLEIDEWPVLARGFREPLLPGMTIAVEPKFTFPDIGVIGIENTYLITDTGCVCLTVSSENIFEI